MNHCIDGTEYDFTSYHFWFSEEWLTKALEHARQQEHKRTSLVLAIKGAGPHQYKIVDGIGGLETVCGPGDWEPIVREEFNKPLEATQ